MDNVSSGDDIPSQVADTAQARSENTGGGGTADPTASGVGSESAVEDPRVRHRGQTESVGFENGVAEQSVHGGDGTSHINDTGEMGDYEMGDGSSIPGERGIPDQTASGVVSESAVEDPRVRHRGQTESVGLKTQGLNGDPLEESQAFTGDSEMAGSMELRSVKVNKPEVGLKQTTIKSFWESKTTGNVHNIREDPQSAVRVQSRLKAEMPMDVDVVDPITSKVNMVQVPQMSGVRGRKRDMIEGDLAMYFKSDVEQPVSNIIKLLPLGWLARSTLDTSIFQSCYSYWF